MYQPLVRVSILFLVLLFSLGARAAPDEAKDFVVALTRDLETALMTAREQGLLENQQHLDDLIDEHILPNIDRETLCKQVFRPRWEDIVAQGKTDDAYDAVLASLKRTYRLALAAYNGQQIEVSDSIDKGSYSIVRTRVHTRENGHNIDLALRRFDDGWRIFDLSVDGVVVTKTLNGSIQRVLQAGDIDAVINAINPPPAP
ncbi:Tgt2/MlaC family protein [Marinobacterium rhizophilum]|uniref:ABC transporter substrate-binding protein n=1 Tax=Marinobacterium rhizophilum TaxID=420402 RepID=A0ABY5HLM5_9GAMM|nr:ABC transporter substrate-binding protein [Marinobacterium rhizophilum]UTW12169.1 ABC transporter substrate-binding protein [Marinobacterium rhizophilum]